MGRKKAQLSTGPETRSPVEIEEAIVALRRDIPRTAVRAVVLFGSAARGEARKDSDVDILILPKTPRAGEHVLAIVREIENRIPVRISTVVSHSPSLNDLELQFLESILRQGVALVGKMPQIGVSQLDLEPVRLLTLDLTGMGQRQKVSLERRLFGYSTHKTAGKRTYHSRSAGLIGAWGGRRLGRGLVLIPEKAAHELDEVLRESGAKRILVPAWVQRP